MNNALTWPGLPPHIFRRPRVGDSFLGWTLRRWFTYLLIIGNLARIFPLVPATAHVSWVVWIITHNDQVQMIVVGAMTAAWLIFPFKDEKFLDKASGVDHLKEPVKSAHYFYWFWFALMLCWFGFYLADLIVKNAAPAEFASLENLGVMNMVNAFEGVWFLLLYAEMTTITVTEKGARSHAAGVWAVGIALSYCVIVALALQFHSPWWSVVSGLYVGIAMALLIGRFESHLIKAPSALTALLFLYAVVQLLYPLFYVSGFMQAVCQTFAGSPCNQMRAFQDVVTFAALLLKCLMFLTVDWMYFGGRLLFYMDRVRPIIHDDTEWNDFLAEVR